MKPRFRSMMANLILIAVLLLFASEEAAAQALPKFMGRKIRITTPKTDADGFFPEGPASVCIEAPPRRQCYTAPEDFGGGPSVAVVRIKKHLPALFFSAASGGVSQVAIHFALLRPGAKNDLDDLFQTDIEVSNQNQHAFWSDSSISDTLIFVTADYVWGPDEAHYDKHRYIVSAYTYKHQSLTNDESYFLEDRYMTAKRYNLEAKDDVLASEKQEVLARLKRLASERRTSP
jgi:hypothetical protein